MNIKILSNTIINRIAAGEVVERPASAIKELVENSIDAKASKIDILIENAGRNMINIIDDGVGMSRDELCLAVERHTTSKLPDEDINNIEFFGFRGEALPSIASVSRMNITSKPKNLESEFAWRIDVIGGDKSEPQPSALSKGTKIEVRDLFFATPARLKFLKSEKVELHHISDCLNKIAMANPNIAFSLTSDGKELFNYKSYLEQDALYNRLNDIVGKGFKENFTYIELDNPECSIKGYISTPTYNLGTSNEQYFFINKRPIRDKLISMAVKIAYQDFIPQGRYPLVYLFLDIDPSFVDVNVHPAKAEVRFKDANLIRSIVIAAIKQGIQNIGKQASDHLTSMAIDYFKAEVIPSITREVNTTPYMPAARPKPVSLNIASTMFKPISPVVKTDEPTEVQEVQTNFPLGAACGQIHDTYIISQTEDGVVLIDQHAAHERIFYEKLKQQILSKQISTQRLLIPEIMEFSEHVIEQLLAQKQDFEQLGLVFEAFGSKAISITELPALLKCIDVRKLILDIVDDLSEYAQGITLENKINHFLATFACHHSIRAGRPLSTKEMNSLLREMEQTDHTGQCNHGRPTYIKLSLKDIEKLFERC